MVEVQTQVNLAEHTTLRIGGPAEEFVTAKTEVELISALNCSIPILILGAGSNLLIADTGFAGRVIHIQTTGKDLTDNQLNVAAGENWDEFVLWAVDNGFGFFAPLTGIPGTVGATPIQNVGAYGTEVSELIESVTVFDRLTKERLILTNNQCRFGYRNSLFKQEPERFVVLQVQFKPAKVEKIEVKYEELAKKLGVNVSDSVDARRVLTAVREIRASKGMLLDATDSDTYSVGSFFLNPRVSDDIKTELPSEVPAWQQQDGSWKISAAWLIANSGFVPGYRVGDASISSKHMLALCNRGKATAKEIMQLAQEVRLAVKSRFGIELEFEPTIL